MLRHDRKEYGSGEKTIIRQVFDCVSGNLCFTTVNQTNSGETSLLLCGDELIEKCNIGL